jgi:hypothetical protein
MPSFSLIFLQAPVSMDVSEEFEAEDGSVVDVVCARAKEELATKAMRRMYFIAGFGVSNKFKGRQTQKKDREKNHHFLKVIRT